MADLIAPRLSQIIASCLLVLLQSHCYLTGNNGFWACHSSEELHSLIPSICQMRPSPGDCTPAEMDSSASCTGIQSAVQVAHSPESCADEKKTHGRGSETFPETSNETNPSLLVLFDLSLT